jgi:hypothetical protein
MPGDLRDDVCSGAKTVDADAGSLAGFPQRAIADKPSTQKRCRRNVVIHLGYQGAEPLIDGSELSIAAIKCISGKFRVFTKIFKIRSTIAALSTRPAKPGNAYPFSTRKSRASLTHVMNRSNDFMTWYQRNLRIRQFTVDDVKIRATYRAR